MKLEELLGEELYKQVKEKIDAANANEPDELKHIRYADLSEGEYVSKGKYDTAVAEKENLAGQIKTYALKDSLTKQGVLDPDYLIYKAGGLDKFTFDKEGRPVGVEDALKPYKADTAMAHLFKQEQQKPPYHPQGGTGGSGSANPFAKETFNLTKQGELLKSNPEQAKAMAAAAGVTI